MRTQLRIRLALGAEIPRSVQLFAFPDALIAQVPQIASFRYIVVEDDDVIVDPVVYEIAKVISESAVTVRSTQAQESPERHQGPWRFAISSYGRHHSGGSSPRHGFSRAIGTNVRQPDTPFWQSILSIYPYLASRHSSR